MSGVFDKIVEGLPSLPQSAKTLPRIIAPAADMHPSPEEDTTLTEDSHQICLSFQHREVRFTDPDPPSKFQIPHRFCNSCL